LAKIRGAGRCEEELELAMAQLENFERLIPRENRIHYVLRDMESVALSNHVAIDSLTIASGMLRGQYVEIPMTLNVSGTYNNIIGFLDGIADIERVINVHSLSFAGGRELWREGGETQDRAVRSPDAYISSTIQVTTYARPRGDDQVGAGS
jgi:Tfp pilus assembly protein PilO